MLAGGAAGEVPVGAAVAGDAAVYGYQQGAGQQYGPGLDPTAPADEAYRHQQVGQGYGDEGVTSVRPQTCITSAQHPAII